MSWPQTGATHYHAQLGLPYKGRVIKGLVVCYVVWPGSMKGIDLRTCARYVGLPCCCQDDQRDQVRPLETCYIIAQLKDKILPNQFMPNWIVLWAGSRTRSFCSHVGIVWCEGKQEFRNPRNLSSWNLKSRPHKKLKYEHK